MISEALEQVGIPKSEFMRIIGRITDMEMTLQEAKQKYERDCEYRYCVCTWDNIPHTLCKTYKEAEETIKDNFSSVGLKIVDLVYLDNWKK